MLYHKTSCLKWTGGFYLSTFREKEIFAYLWYVATLKILIGMLRFGTWPVITCICFNIRLGAFHLCCLAGIVAGKLGNPYLRYHNRQPLTYFLLMATLEMLAILVLPLNGKRPCNEWAVEEKETE